MEPTNNPIAIWFITELNGSLVFLGQIHKIMKGQLRYASQFRCFSFEYRKATRHSRLYIPVTPNGLLLVLELGHKSRK